MGNKTSKEGKIEPRIKPKLDDQSPDTKDDMEEESMDNPLGRKLLDPTARFRKAISAKLAGMTVTEILREKIETIKELSTDIVKDIEKISEIHNAIFKKLEKHRHSKTNSDGVVFYERETVDQAFSQYSSAIAGMLDEDINMWEKKLEEDAEMQKADYKGTILEQLNQERIEVSVIFASNDSW